MKEIAAAKFKEHCLAILDEVDEDGIVITKRGKPVAELSICRCRSADVLRKQIVARTAMVDLSHLFGKYRSSRNSGK